MSNMTDPIGPDVGMEPCAPPSALQLLWWRVRNFFTPKRESNLIRFARSELDRINFGKDDTEAMIGILERFFDQWDSGGAVWAAAPVLQRLIAGKPLSPLTGADDEWMEVGSGVFQNVRCSSVFKDPRFHDGKLAYNIDAAEPRAAITFPYWSDQADVRAPVIEV